MPDFDTVNTSAAKLRSGGGGEAMNLVKAVNEHLQVAEDVIW